MVKGRRDGFKQRTITEHLAVQMYVGQLQCELRPIGRSRVVV